MGLLVLIILLGGMAAGPLKSFTLGADRVDTLAASRDQLRAEVDRLEERRVRLEDPEELEIIAREQLNLVKPGEVPFIVVTPEAEFERAEPGQGAAGVDDAKTMWRRVADALAGLFG
ncbi:MAG TPA: septum formation initiator family protein [Egibacteraceae bacterium]|nr:septum formation initiator family protein [Egibacteraceae bacterium]